MSASVSITTGQALSKQPAEMRAVAITVTLWTAVENDRMTHALALQRAIVGLEHHLKAEMEAHGIERAGLERVGTPVQGSVSLQELEWPLRPLETPL